jgi:hypothetical protein
MGSFFLFREVKTRGDVPGNREFWRGKRIVGQRQFSPFISYHQKIIPAKQPIKMNNNQVESLPKNKQQEVDICRSWLALHVY